MDRIIEQWQAVNSEKDAPVRELNEEIKALVAQSQKRSAVFDIVTNPTNVNVSVA